tara:strand:+ start:92 stop:202 length:111 start_codon:yes stop_codon:yes gene_type:complete
VVKVAMVVLMLEDLVDLVATVELVSSHILMVLELLP